MVADKDGYVLLCQHTNRRIVRVAKDLQITPYIEKFEGKRFNSPNDLVYRSDGSLYFTDPPYGLLKQDDDPAKELKFNGVFRYAGGKLQAVVKDLTRPNGLAFSPDEKTFYVSNSDEKRRIWMRYDVAANGTVSNGRVFADVTAEKEEGLPDGMKVDSQGNVYGTGPGGIWVFSADGKHLGTIKPPEQPANCGWGDDGKTLYITARTGVYRLKLAVAGEKPLYQ
jgi:gluconolactonase